jgi:hypothetical protein
MKWIAPGAIFGVFLAGCSTYLPGPNATINVDAITFAILTELYCAAKELPGSDRQAYFGSDDKWIALIDMYLSASIEASATPTVSLLGPFNLAKATPVGGTIGTFTAGIGGSFDETRTKLQEYKLYINLQQLLYGTTGKGADEKVAYGPNWARFAEINDWPVWCENPNAGGTYLQGQLGLKDWLAPAVRVQEATIGFAPLNPPAIPTAPPPPTISAIYPSSGSTEGNYPVYIIGTNLDQVKEVLFKAPLEEAARPPVIPDKKASTSTMLVVTSPKNMPAGISDIAIAAPAKSGSRAAEGAKINIYATAKFTYITPPAPPAPPVEKLEKPLFPNVPLAPNVAPLLPPVLPISGGTQQSPVVSGTFTFVIKSGATVGPAFTLSRVSGGASLFSMTRTDNNYVNMSLTAVTYCPSAASVPTLKGCIEARKKTADNVNANDHKAAIDRLDAANQNLNLSRIVQP